MQTPSYRKVVLNTFMLLLISLYTFGSTTSTNGEIPKPNILWVYIEDLSPWMSCYGYDFNQTPNIDRLAKEGVQFNKAFMPAPVCSATRSALITGVMQTTLGMHNHRSSVDSSALIHLPKHVKTLPQLFKEAGYYTFNYNKEDYNFSYERDSLYSGQEGQRYKKLNLNQYDWSFAQQQKPWFGQIMLMGGKNRDKVDSPMKAEDAPLSPYYPDHPVIRKYTARHFDEARITDRELDEVLEHLKSKGMLENTVVYFFSDHGWNDAPRHKQFCYDGGLHVPLIIKSFSKAIQLDTKIIRHDLVSGLDISTTSLAMAGIEIPKYMDGKDLFAKDFKEREYVISARDRCDYTIDRIRTVRSKRYRYVRNFMTDRPYMQPQYRDKRPFMTAMREVYKEGKMTPLQASYMSDKRPYEELYDYENDPNETVNLANDPMYKKILKKHRKVLDKWIKDTDDKGQYPESKASLKVVFKRWGERCVNPEYDIFQ